MADVHGTFSGNPKTEWLHDAGDEDRDMQLLEEFWYDDPQGRRWRAPAGSRVNGASIPRALWSVVGSPYTDNYRRASVVHDIACDDPTVPRLQADKMFYEACLAGGCPTRQAQLLYAGVRIGAWVPNVRFWEPLGPADLIAEPSPSARLTEQSMRATYYEIASDITSRGAALPFAELETLVEQHLRAKAAQ